ncbi:E3 UFM1-protein ligase 1-like [Homarus americanus]|uniref:E3 UFM1-protein ligase 1-like n=1 Tax=Homarus americanus TaxID=6706 RepID=UPI001C454254|nr:E3 UFM1-protein ligase 1-like [Homarus americanus]
MSSSDWEEVKRLAADFQRAQLASTVQKLSERNCVEIVNKLVELGLLDIYHTNDGKEYITPAQLTKEIQDEVFIHGGRVNLVDLVDVLSVDHSVIEKRALALAHSESNTCFVLGQLITQDYLDAIAEEINEKLQQEGSTTVADLVKHYELPGDFMLEVVVERLGTIIQGQQDTHDHTVIFTNAFVARHKAHVRGVLCAITQPTQVSTIIAQHGFQQRLFFSVAEKLIATGRVSGALTGGRQIHRAMYIPSIYSRTQNEWVDNFLKQNGYLEFEALRRLEISDPEGHIRRRFKDEDLTFVGEVCVGSSLIDQIDAAIDDALLSGGWVDIYPLLPTVFSPEEGNQLVDIALKRRQDKKSTATAKVFYHTVVVSDQLLTKLSNHLQQMMPKRAKEAVEKGAFKQQVDIGKLKHQEEEFGRNKKEERRKKAATGKAGGGTQGRETKTKASKNKYKGRKGAAHDSESDDDVNTHPTTGGGGRLHQIEFMSETDMQLLISDFEELADCPEELVEELTNHFHRPLTKIFQEVAKSVFMATVAVKGDTRRKTHQQLQEKVSALLTTIKLADKSVKVFDEDKQSQLRKHLLKTQCSEMVNELVLYLADDSLIEIARDKEVTPEIRLKIIKKLSEEMIEPLQNVHKTLSGSSVEDFVNVVDDAIAITGIMLKKKDNKKDRQVLVNHRCALLEQLDGTIDAPLTLHLACLVLFQAVTGNMLHASGKFVPHILAYIKSHVPFDKFSVLQEYQDLVIKSLTTKTDLEADSDVKLRLETLTPIVKETAITFKKAAAGLHNTEE